MNPRSAPPTQRHCAVRVGGGVRAGGVRAGGVRAGGGAACALLAALAGIAAHGLADPTMASHVPSFNALFLLTSGVLALGALGGLGASWTSTALARGARGRGGRVGAILRWLADSTLVGLILPVTAGQWFSHVMLVADFKLAAGAAGGAGPGGAGFGAGALGGHGHGIGAANAQSAAEHASHVDDPVHWLPMLAAHAGGILVCLAIIVLLTHVLVLCAERIVQAAPEPALPPRAPRARRLRTPMCSCIWRAAVAPRGPPRLLDA